MRDSNRVFWIFIIITAVSIVTGGIRLIRHSIVKPSSPKVALPSRPFTAKDIPVLRAKVNALNADAEVLTKLSPRLSASDQVKVDQVWEEIFYTPGYYPSFVEVRTIEMARVAQRNPEIAAHMDLVKAYEDGRYAIANDPAITDKATALGTLSKRLGPGLKNPEFARYKAKFLATRRELIGDPVLDAADLRYQRFMRTEIARRLPHLTGHYERSMSHYEAWTAHIAQANALFREIKELETQTVHARSPHP